MSTVFLVICRYLANSLLPSVSEGQFLQHNVLIVTKHFFFVLVGQVRNEIGPSTGNFLLVSVFIS